MARGGFGGDFEFEGGPTRFGGGPGPQFEGGPTIAPPEPVPLPATQALGGGGGFQAPAFQGGPTKFGGGPGPQLQGGPTRFGGGPGPQPTDDRFQQLPPQPPTGQPQPFFPPPEIRSSQAPGLQAANPSGNQELDAIRNEAAQNFQLGTFDLSDKATNDRGLEIFHRAIRAGGGDPDALRSEIGPVRFGDRMREFFGKGDTLNQSGIIQIGNGQTLSSLRDLGDFNNPNAGPQGGGGGGGGGGGPAPGSLIPGTGPGFPGVPAQFVGGAPPPRPAPTPTLGPPTGGLQPPPPSFGGGPERIPPGTGGLEPRFDGGPITAPPEGQPPSEFQKFGEDALRQIFESGGIDEGILQNVRQSLREQLEGERQAGIESIGESLNRRGIGGAGVEASEIGRFSEGLNASNARALRDTATGLGVGALDRQLSAAAQAAGLGTTQRGQDITRELGLGNISLGERGQDVTQRGQDISRELGIGNINLGSRGQDITQQLGLGDLDVRRQQNALQSALGFAGIDLNRELGRGDLALRNLTQDQNFANMLFNQNLSTAGFQHAVEQARQGNVNDLLSQFNQMISGRQQGFF